MNVRESYSRALEQGTLLHLLNDGSASAWWRATAIILRTPPKFKFFRPKWPRNSPSRSPAKSDDKSIGRRARLRTHLTDKLVRPLASLESPLLAVLTLAINRVQQSPSCATKPGIVDSSWIQVCVNEGIKSQAYSSILNF